MGVANLTFSENDTEQVSRSEKSEKGSEILISILTVDQLLEGFQKKGQYDSQVPSIFKRWGQQWHLSWLVSFMYHFLGTTTFLTLLFSVSSLWGSTCYFSDMAAYKLKSIKFTFTISISCKLNFQGKNDWPMPVLVLYRTLRQPHTGYKWKQQKTCFSFNPIAVRPFFFFTSGGHNIFAFFHLQLPKFVKDPSSHMFSESNRACWNKSCCYWFWMAMIAVQMFVKTIFQ